MEDSGIDSYETGNRTDWPVGAATSPQDHAGAPQTGWMGQHTAEPVEARRNDSGGVWRDRPLSGAAEGAS